MIRKTAALIGIISILAACGGGGGGSSPSTNVVPTTGPTATPTPLGPVSTSASATTSTSSSTTASLAVISTGYSGSVVIPITTGTPGTVSLTLQSTPPGSATTVQSVKRLPQYIGGSVTAVAYVSFTSASTALSVATGPAFTFTLPTGTTVPAGDNFYLGFFDPANPTAGWSTLAGPALVNGTSVSFGRIPGPITYAANIQYVFALFYTGQALIAATPAPEGANPGVMAAYECSTSAAGSSVARASAGGSTTDAVRRSIRKFHGDVAATGTTQLAITYRPGAIAMSDASTAVTSQEAAVGAKFIRQLDLSRSNKLLRLVSVPTASVASAEATLRSQSAVETVGTAGGRRSALTVTTPYFPSDPYFQGFTAAQNTAAQNAAPSTYETLPYAESAGVPGQWDMHAIKLDYAFGYSQAANGSGIVNANALGSSNIRLAIIDTGVDQTHPELASKITHARCYITDPNGVQSTGNYTTDGDGHGTDVAGIAAADTGNSFGFTGTGGNTSLYAYRVFPTPDDSCANDTTADAQCSADTGDIAAAITDAVNSGANVISMSLGGDNCVTPSPSNPSGDSDAMEGAAITYAIQNNVIVVAASGNSGTAGVAAPGCDTGVIAAGASALDDGTTNGSGTAGSVGGTSANPVEYVASYTQYGSPLSAYHSASAWGIVAPGGDPTGDTSDDDDLHWIENIWTSTPYMLNANDMSFEGECTNDYPNGKLTTAPDCRTLIAGTSMATPHVAGAAALILAVSGSTYANPTAMKALLCETADDLGPTAGAHEGCGRLNVYRAMAYALNDPVKP